MKQEQQDNFISLISEDQGEFALTAYERRLTTSIIESLKLEGIEERTLIGLRQQFDAARVTSRQFTGHGFFVNLFIPDGIQCVGIANPFGSVTVGIPGQANGGGAMAFCEKGLLAMLEVWTWGDEGWPFESARDVVFGHACGGLVHPEPVE